MRTASPLTSQANQFAGECSGADAMGVNRLALLLPIGHLGMCMRPAEEGQAAHWPSNHVSEHPVGIDMCLAIQLKSFGKVFDA
jgi:hypothetical protein